MRNEEGLHQVFVGNEFAIPKPRLKPVIETPAPIAMPSPLVAAPAMEMSPPSISYTAHKTSKLYSIKDQVLDLMHNNSVIVFALLFLMVGVALIQFGSNYIMSHDNPDKGLPAFSINKSSIGGLNKTVNSSDMPTFLQNVTSQPATINLGSQTVTISPSTIQGWLQTTSGPGGQNDIHVSAAVIYSSLNSIVNQYVVAPVNEVTATCNGSSEVAIAGTNGTQLSSTADLQDQSDTIAKNLLSDKGFEVNAPLTSLPFQSDTPANFSKIIIVNLSTKDMCLYQNGQQINTFLVSAGKPSTPTPVGEFHIWDKLTSQTMVGPGYVQPNVPWVNYFDHSGDAIHGVYWRPASVFGSVNTSHGCVGVPVSTGEYIYNWAPIGTTVITTPN